MGLSPLNMKLNDLRKNLKFLPKKNQFVKSLKIGRAWHTLPALLLYELRL